MKVCFYAKESYTDKENAVTNKYYFATSFRNKETGDFDVKHHVIFSSNDYNVGETVEVSRSKTGKYFIPNKK